jgi:hypothetical protein
MYNKLQEIDVRHIFDYQPFYVGKGTGNRIKRGIETKLIKTNPFKKRVIEKIKSKGLSPIAIKLKENLTPEEACTLEIIIIKEIGRAINKTGCLTNLTRGGEGVIGHIISEKTKAKISKTIKNNYLKNPALKEEMRKRAMGNKYMLGKTHSKETIALIGKKSLGRKDTIDTREKKSKSFKGRIYSKEHNNKISIALTGKILTDKHKKKSQFSPYRENSE